MALSKENKDLIGSYVGFDPSTTRIRKEDKLLLLTRAYEAKVPQMAFEFIIGNYRYLLSRLEMIDTWKKDMKEFWKRENRKAS